jgi:hypothetical protein
MAADRKYQACSEPHLCSEPPPHTPCQALVQIHYEVRYSYVGTEYVADHSRCCEGSRIHSARAKIFLTVRKVCSIDISAAHGCVLYQWRDPWRQEGFPTADQVAVPPDTPVKAAYLPEAGDQSLLHEVCRVVTGPCAEHSTACPVCIDAVSIPGLLVVV